MIRLKQPSGTEIRHNTEKFTCDPLKYTMCSPILMVSICMGKSIRIQKGEVLTRFLLCNINFGLETFSPFSPTILKPDLENKNCNYCNLSLFLLLFLFF